jgi:chromosome segregation ATPase
MSSLLGEAEKERDALRVDKATLQQMLYSIKNRLEAAEKSDAESLAMYRKAGDERDALRAALQHEADCVEAVKSEIEALRAKIAAMEQQKPARLVTPTAYRWRYRGAVKWQYGELTEETARVAKEHNHEVQPLYLAPGAKGE